MARFTKAELESFAGQSIPPLVGPDLRLLFIGINPGLWTAATRTPFAHPGNRFYPALFRAGIIDRLPDYASGFTDEDRAWFTGRGLGVSNIVDRATRGEADLGRDELRAGAELLRYRVSEWKPRVVAFVGLGAYRTAFAQPKAVQGEQDERFEGAGLWVLPNPSGLNAHDTVQTLAEAYAAPARAAGVL
jgi:TDG/mug DNA glycosylase family protein